MIDRRGVVMGALLLAIGGDGLALAASDERTAEEVVEALYAEHEKRADGSRPPEWEDPATKDLYFSPDLLKTFAASDKAAEENPDDVIGLDGDPFYDAQDWEIRNLKIGEAAPQGDDRATVTVTFDNYGEANELRYAMVRTEGGWRIDDIAYEHGEEDYTLRDILSTE